MGMDAIEGWHGYVRSRDGVALAALLYEDAVFESPVVHTPQKGRALVMKYLSGATAVLGGPEFRYVGEWRNETGAVLEFETVIDGIRINGVDIIALDAGGTRIIRFKVMIRPLKAIALIHRLMGERLAGF